MAVKNDQSLVAVIDGLTTAQAANIQADLVKSKNKHAPKARAIAVHGHRDDTGKTLSSAHDDVKKINVKGDSNGQKK